MLKTLTQNAIFKRLIDIVASMTGLIVLSPFLILVGVLVLWKMGSPVFFRQVRPGLGGKPFEILKFRTMRVASDSSAQSLADADRITGLGRFLRSSSLDELPELWNVIKGDMSLVGPRPLLMEYLERYSDEQARRHEVRPGITGWAQVNGRNAIDWEEKFVLDVWYVDHANLWLDIKIVLLTIWQVLGRKNISADNHSTMPVFMGAQSMGTGEAEFGGMANACSASEARQLKSPHY